MHIPKRRPSQGDTVGKGEGSDRAQQSLPAADYQQQGKDKQEVVDSKQDMLDTECGVDPDNLKIRGFRLDFKAGFTRCQARHLCHAILTHGSDQYIGSGVLKTKDGYTFTSDSGWAAD